MDREQILAEVRRTARENDGRPLGQVRFARATGIAEATWSRYWVRWGDVCRSAGYEPNTRPAKVDEAVLFAHLAELTRELGSYPTRNEIKMARRSDGSFPSHNTFARLGDKETTASRLLAFCESADGYGDVVPVLAPLVSARKKDREEVEETDAVGRSDDVRQGYVYLMRSGRFHKIGRSAAPGRREYEIAIQMPEKLELVHQIETDDMDGIETYWHQRFADRRANGEWFKLTKSDIRAFKSRKSM